MNLYRLRVSENFTSYSAKGYKNSLECNKTDVLTDKWEEKKLIIIERRKDADLAFCFNPMGHLILSQRAVDSLKDSIDFEEIELLPVKKGKERYYILHGIKAHKLTCDIVKKGIKFRYIFKEKELKECGIEKKLVIKAEMNHGVLSDLFFTEKFVELVKEFNLQGVEFEVEWNSEESS